MKSKKRFISIFNKWFVILFAIMIITLLEITAFLKLPNRNLFSLIQDIIAMFVGFLLGISINKIIKWISYEHWVNVVFGFVFLGIGWIGIILLNDRVNIFNRRDLYIGSIIIIISLILLIVIEKPTVIKDPADTKKIIKKMSNITAVVKHDEGKLKKLIITETPTVFFHNRMCEAFPGLSGITWITKSKVAIERLQILLREPTHFDDSKGYGTRGDPIWWLRGSRNLYIHKFNKLRHNRCLMNIDELRIKKIAIIKSVVYWQDCVYVETSPDKPTGLYKHSKKEIEQSINEFGFCWEEYGIFGKRLINRTEYDDNAIIIKGKSIRTHGAELRARYISKYNFIISSATAPYNSHSIDRKLKQCLNGLLYGAASYDEFFSWLMQLPRNPNDN